MSKELPFNERTLMSLVDALADEVIHHGTEEAMILSSKSLTPEEADTILKTNTFLTAYAALLVMIVENNKYEYARDIIQIWTSPAIQELVQHAFTDEIASATNAIAKGIDDIERFINGVNPKE